jgi:hypothetical protein
MTAITHHALKQTIDARCELLRINDFEACKMFIAGSTGSFANYQIFQRLNTDELHFPNSRSSEWTNEKIREDSNVLIDLFLEVLRNISIARNREALLGDPQHPSCTNFPDP